MKPVFAPGCALILYKPQMAEKLHELLSAKIEPMERLDLCCTKGPILPAGTEVINVCPGCDRRYRENYADASTVSLWEVLAGNDFFPFPDYGGLAMAVLDACPTRSQERVHKAVRTLLARMNINVVEAENSGLTSTCCGDSFWGALPVEEVKTRMAARAAEMPVEDVAVYCVSCSKSVFIGGKKPRYLVDLLFGEDTVAGTYEPAEWHGELDDFISGH
ncbi:MAG: heterodisulfide reductase-related iron-sulfur binding cluster [Negativicutes bacterium]|nr:heterodisulfide reductase-related iron-sulfur binding cluster [Negativicutes bacterium]